MNLSSHALAALLPMLIPAVGACLLPLAALDRDQSTQKWIRGAMFFMALVALTGAFFYLTHLWVTGLQPTYGPVVMDRLAQFNGILVLVAAALTVLQLWDHLHQEGWVKGEALALLLASVTGMMLFGATTHLLVLFLALELLSLPLYVLTALVRTRGTAPEGGMKYFLTGAVAASCVLMGVALLYGASGSLEIPVVLERLSAPGMDKDPLVLLGMVLVLLGFLFKVSLVPFHQWTPDVYEAAPAPIAGFMSVATKGVAFIALLRVFPWHFSLLPTVAVKLSAVLPVLAVLTLVVGNLAALNQRNVKRMLAYSSISHAGYLLLAFVAGTSAAYEGMLFYLLGYMAMNLGAFGLLSAFGLVGDRTELVHLRGLGWKRPELGVAAVICVFSLAGLPPTAGFFGKYQIFKELIQQGHAALAILGVLASLVSMGYYLKILMALFLEKPSESQLRDEADLPEVDTPGASGSVLVAALLVVFLGLMPGLVQRALTHRAIHEPAEQVIKF